MPLLEAVGQIRANASSLRFALKFAWFASFPRCYPFSGRQILCEARIDSQRIFAFRVRIANRFARIGPLRARSKISIHDRLLNVFNPKGRDQMFKSPGPLGLFYYAFYVVSKIEESMLLPSVCRTFALLPGALLRPRPLHFPSSAPNATCVRSQIIILGVPTCSRL